MVIGGALALSSTAIVLRMLVDRGELTSRFGRSCFAVLLVQDMMVGPFLVLALALGGDGEMLGLAVGEAMLKAEGYADKLRSIAPEVKPIAVGGFAGVLQFARTPWPARLALRMLSIATGVKEGDYRDWAAIRSWTLSQLQTS